MKRFLVMLTFLTRIPAKINFQVEYDDYVKGIIYVPVIALIIGLPLYFLDMLDVYLNGYVLSFLIVLAYIYLSGGLHIDGLADTMDALGSNRSKTRMLEIMSDPRMGTFGVLTIVMYCLGLVLLMPFVPRASILLFPLVGRGCSLLCASTHRYAKEKGLGKSYIDGAKWWHVLICVALYSGIYFALNRGLNINDAIIAFAPVLGAALVAWLFVHGISKKLDGITGDVVGYSVEMSQLVYLGFTYIAVAIVGG